LPNNARILVGPLAQLQDSLIDSARTHGASTATAWRRVALPVLSRYALWVWLYCFAGTLLELPISQLLYPPGSYPLSVAIERRLQSYDFAGGTAMEVLAVLGALGVLGAALALFRLLAPAGWRRVGETT
jgi:iron(III) transport system permease protein